MEPSALSGPSTLKPPVEPLMPSSFIFRPSAMIPALR
jgi:hypothetical protein